MRTTQNKVKLLACFPVMMIGCLAGFVWQSLRTGFSAGSGEIRKLAARNSHEEPEFVVGVKEGDGCLTVTLTGKTEHCFATRRFQCLRIDVDEVISQKKDEIRREIAEQMKGTK